MTIVVADLLGKTRKECINHLSSLGLPRKAAVKVARAYFPVRDVNMGPRRSIPQDIVEEFDITIG